MGTIFFLMIMFSFVFIISIESRNTDSNILPKCNAEGPEIITPFTLQNQSCSYPGFQFTCQQNQTVIHFPSYGDLFVKSISYGLKKLNLVDPKSCVHEVFLNLNLSNTPLDYYYVLKSYTYVNCSARISPMFHKIPCLSGSYHHVYVVESIEGLPSFCRVIKTKGIPFSYSPYVSDNSFGLGFTWDLTGYEDCKVGGGSFEPWLGKVGGFVIMILVAAIFVSVKNHFSKVVWDYTVANVNEVFVKDIESYHSGDENHLTDKEILAA